MSLPDEDKIQFLASPRGKGPDQDPVRVWKLTTWRQLWNAQRLFQSLSVLICRARHWVHRSRPVETFLIARTHPEHTRTHIITHCPGRKNLAGFLVIVSHTIESLLRLRMQDEYLCESVPWVPVRKRATASDITLTSIKVKTDDVIRKIDMI